MSVVLSLCAFSVNALDINDLPDPEADAKVGEWAEYQLKMDGLNKKMKMTVIKVDKDNITVELATTMDGKVQTQIQVQPRTKVPIKRLKEKLIQSKATITVKKEKIKVKDKEIECFVVSGVVDGKDTIAFISKDIPLSVSVL